MRGHASYRPLGYSRIGTDGGFGKIWVPRRQPARASCRHARTEGQRSLRAHRRSAAGDRRAGRWRGLRAPPPGPAGGHRHGQDLHRRQADRGGAEADPGDGPQQDAGGAALPGVQGVLPGQRGRVLRQLLRLLPAGGLPPALRYVHREGLVPERRDRPAAPQRHAGAVRAARRDHRGLGVVHLRHRCTDRLRRHRAQPQGRRQVPARRRAAPPGRPAVPAQRCAADPFQVPGARRRAGVRAGVRRLHRAGRLLRRRDRADRGGRRPDRRGAGRAARRERLPGHPLRDAARQADEGGRGDRGGDGGAGRAAPRRGSRAGGRAAAAAHRSSTPR